MTLVHITGIPDTTTGLVHLTVSTSGQPVDQIVVTRRLVGGDTQVAIIAPAPYLDQTTGLLRPINGQAQFDDVTAPLDVAFEYLAAPAGEPLLVASEPITLTNPGGWWLSDPLRPYLNVMLSLRRSIPSCATTQAIFFLSMPTLTSQAHSTLTTIPARPDAYHNSLPMGLPSGSLMLATRRLEDLVAVSELLAPGGVLLLRAPSSGLYGFENLFVSVSGVVESRLVSDHRHPGRRVELPFTVVLQPAGGSYGGPGVTWDSLCDGPYATLAAALADGVSWRTIAYGIMSGAFPAAWRTCAEVNATWATCAALAATGKTCLQLVTGA